jgi:hypothetical protein
VLWDREVNGSFVPTVHVFDELPTATPALELMAPTSDRALKSGRLNVVEPSPTPKYVLVIANRLE